MNIIIDGKLAVLKSGSSFDYIAENRYFTGSDSYTLNIVFPLRGCSQNIAIFGHLYRKDVRKEKIVFDCEIRDKGFSKYGIITITEINEVEVKTQFLEGKSADNYVETLEDIYVNEIKIGYPDSNLASDYNMGRLASHKYIDFVALPWGNNTSGNIQNDMYVDEPGVYRWNCKTLSFQPYLIEVAKKMMAKLDYKVDFKAWEDSAFDNLIMCNALPAAWVNSRRGSTRAPSASGMDFCTALPHWTVVEFFEQLGYFMDGEFAFDHKHKICSFKFNKDLISSAGTYYINKVVDEYTGEVTQEDETTYLEHVNLKFKQCDHEMWNLYFCNWFIKDLKSYYSFDTVKQMVNDHEMLELKKRPTVIVAVNDRNGHITYPYGGNLRGNTKAGYSVFYCKDVNTFFTLHCYGVEYTGYTTKIGVKVYYRLYELIPINAFGDREMDEKGHNVEIGIVPVWIDDIDQEKGKCIFLDVPDDGVEIDEEYEDRMNSDGSINWSANTSNIIQPTTFKLIKAGNKDASTEYFDKLYVGFWAGINPAVNGQPRPDIDRVTMNSDWSYVIQNRWNMRLNEYSSTRAKTYSIDGKQKYTFKFLADEVPNPRCLFFIHGQKYICERITATFKDGVGMSNMLKGVFYRVTDSII